MTDTFHDSGKHQGEGAYHTPTRTRDYLSLRVAVVKPRGTVTVPPIAGDRDRPSHL